MNQPKSAEPPPTVMIVEDNEGIAGALSALLRDRGYRTVMFHDGMSGLKHAQISPPNAVVIDIHLPDISGLVLSQKLREQLGPAVPIIALSGDTSIETLRELQKVGATHFFSKPVKVGELLTKLKETMTV